MKLRFHILLVFVLGAFALRAQNDTWKMQKQGNWYFSWGYSKWWYPATDIHFDINTTDASSKTVHSEYVVKDAYAHDAAWIKQIPTAPITVPQFCVRIGYFFNKAQTLGFEMTYDHAKFVVNTDQYVRMTGTTNGVAFDSTAHLYPELTTGPQPFIFKLNNGANFFEFTLVRKFTLFNLFNGKVKGSYLLKAGAGWNTPHVENTIFGAKNNPHFQPVGGWNVGTEGALRIVFFNRLYWEFGQKAVFASYYKLRLAQGTARVHFPTYGIIMSLGINFPGKMNKEISTKAD